MKATREQLKSLVKECLLEILSEGLGNVHQATVSRATPQPRGMVENRGPRPRPAFDPRLDTPVGTRGPTQALREAIKQSAGGNPIMADILADTAMTTLPSQLQGGDSMGMPGMGVSHKIAQQEQFNGEVEDVFGDAAAPRADGSSHWADLAFASSKKTA